MKVLAVLLTIAIHDARNNWLASWPVDFMWSSKGEVLDRRCVHISEAAEPLWTTWWDNYLCWKGDEDLVQWSSAGKIDGMRCTQILEPKDPHTWFDNYLCVEYGSPYHFSWSYAGKIEGKSCISWNEPADEATWSDNYLCAPETNSYDFPDPEFPTHFKWSYSGEPTGYNCVQINENGGGYGKFSNNYFCWEEGTKDPEIEWSNNGMIPNKRCTRILERDSSKRFYDNFLCVPRSSPLRFLWSENGKPEDTNSYLQWNEPGSTNWHDNYLYTGNPEYENPKFPDDFYVSYDGVPKGYHCILIYQFLLWGSYKESNTYFCWKHETKDPEIEWSHKGMIDGMRCVHIFEPTHEELTKNTYLCVPKSSPLRFSWSYDGALSTNCIQFKSKGNYWGDNYLCEDKCAITQVDILDSSILRHEYDGMDIIGLTTEGSCIGSGEQFISLETTFSVEEAMTVTFSETSEVNWATTVSLEFGVGSPFIESKVSISQSVGGAYTWQSSEGKSISTATSKTSSHYKYYNAPGGALILGYTEKYKIEKSGVPVKAHYACDSGDTYTKSSTIDFLASAYQAARFKSMSGTFYRDECEKNGTIADCVNNLNWYLGHHISTIEDVELSFLKCFADGKGFH